MAKIIAISNQKGGVGKTTTTISLGVALAKQGKKVLLVDLDPQANLTMSLGYHNPDELPESIATILKSEIAGIQSDCILTKNGVDFIPSSIELSELENILINVMSRENVLKHFLSRYKEAYDYILIDCLPSLNILTVNALNASDEVIIPVQAQYLSAKGLELLLSTIKKVSLNLNSKLKIAGIVITMLDGRANFQKEVVNVIENSYGKHIKVFESKIPMSVKVSEVQSQGTDIFEVKNNKVARGYESLAREVIENE